MKLVHSSISENGNAGWDGKAKAGDQTGKEVCVRSWYSKPWNIMLRYPDRSIAAKAAAAAVKLANSNLVGYDQSERNTLYKALKAVNFDVDAYIKTGKKTESDCSSFVYAVFACFVPGMRSDSNAPVTSTMRNLYRKWGFDVFTGSEYLNGNNLINGDILVKESAHTAMATDGTTTGTTTEPVNMIDIPTYSADVSAAIDTLAHDVIRGKWGNGNDRKEKLYVAIQTRVNELWRAGVR